MIDEGSQVQDAVRDAGAYFASLGEYALFNVVHDEGLVGDKYVRFCLDLLTKGDAPEVVVLEGLNKVDTRSRPFFRSLFRALEGKLVVAVTTRWPSTEAAQAYFESVEGQVRFLECPRLSMATGRKILVLAQSNYEVRFEADTRLSERVLFPVTPSQRNGIEDARFVRFVDDDGEPTYCATYTVHDQGDISRLAKIGQPGAAVRRDQDIVSAEKSR